MLRAGTPVQTVSNATTLVPDILARAGLARGVAIGDVLIREVAGHSNILFDVRAGTDRCAVRFDRARRDRKARDAEIEAMREAWRLGFGAEPLWRDDAAGVLVTRWIDGARPLSGGELKRNPDVLAAAVRTLGAFHRGASPLQRCLDPARVLADVMVPVEAGSMQPGWLEGIVAELNHAANRLAKLEALVPCHCDPSPCNFLSTDAGMRLIDWEYAAMAPAAWDLGYLAVEADLDPGDATPGLVATHGGDVTQTDIVAAMLLAGMQNLLWFAKLSETDPNARGHDLARRRVRIEQAATLLANTT